MKLPTFYTPKFSLIDTIVFVQLCVWSSDAWEKQTSKYLQLPVGRAAAPLADTRVQFHQDQTQLLVVHETQIAIYEASKLECLKQVCTIIYPNCKF